MTLEQLRIFVAVAEREHVTAAARALNLTQSATSAAVAALEARHGTKLFDRIGRRIALTEAGRLFLPEARAVLARAEAAGRLLADLNAMARGSLALAASQTVGNYWLAPRLKLFRELAPGVSVAVRIGNTETVRAMVHDGAADIGLVEGDIADPLLAAGVVGEDELVLVVAPDHPWADKPPRAAALARSPWVLREEGSGTRAIFAAELARAGLSLAELDVALELPTNESVRSAVAAGFGATVISRLAVNALLEAGALAAVGLPMPRRPFYALTHRERTPTRALAAFMDMLSKGEGRGT